MKNLNNQQIESLKTIIETTIPLQGLCFNTPFVKTDRGIEFVVCERYSYNMKIIYVVVPLQIDEQFDRLNDLERITQELCNMNDAQFGYFGTCTFENDLATYLTPNDHQIERLR